MDFCMSKPIFALDKMLSNLGSSDLFQNPEYKYSDFEVIGHLGSGTSSSLKTPKQCLLEEIGSFGNVFQVKHKIRQAQFALKEIPKRLIEMEGLSTQVLNEMQIMKGLKHPNIIRLEGCFEDSEKIYLLLELAEGGQLFQKMKKERKFEEKKAAFYMHQVVLAVDYLHTRDPPIIHRDIKPENILLTSEDNIKLADFGWSNKFKEGEMRQTYCGTLDYLAPEMLKEEGHSEKLDLWCLGVLCFELLTGYSPFSVSNGSEVDSGLKKEENIIVKFLNELSSSSMCSLNAIGLNRL